MGHSEIRRIAFVGDYLPRKCGIATFTGDMHSSLASRFPDAECFVVPVNDRPEGYDYPPEVRFEINEPDLESYRRAADFLNFANTDVVCLQHQYGIYGGVAGGHILSLLRDLRVPVDTPFGDPNPYKDQFGVDGRLVALTFGLLSPNKGVEHMLRAVPEILKSFPNFVYIVLGATHPDLVRDQGERYRL